MKRTNRLYYVLALILVLVLSFTALVACIDPKEEDGNGDDTNIEIRDQLLSNGTFYNATSSTSAERFVKDTVPNWTKTSGAIGYSGATMGVIDVKKLKDNASTIWDSERFKDAANKITISENSPKEIKDDGTRDFEDTNAMIIASTSAEASVYYSSSSSKLEKGKYYVLNIDVWTFIDKKQGEEGEGAYIFVTDGIYSEWIAIDTNGGWETFTLYIEANNFEDRSFGVQLWLGNGPSKIGNVTNPRLTQGVVLFDNIILKEITDEVYAGIDEDELNKDKKHEYVRKESAVFPDMEFEYNRAISSSSTASSTTKAFYSARVGAPYNYTQYVGKTDLSSDKPPVSSAGNAAPYGIFDLAKLYERTETEGTVSWTDTFSKINTTEFLAPAWQDFFAADGTFDNHARAAYQNAEYPNNAYQLKDSRALLIFNNKPSGIGYKSEKKMLLEKGKFYRISVYAYVYVALNLPNKIVDEKGAPIALTDTQYSANEQAINEYNANKIKAHMKLTGASLQDAEELVRYTNELNIPQVAAQRRTETEGETTKTFMDIKMSGTEIDGSTAKYGEWQELTFYVSGNSLSNRTVNVEYWLGEGTKDEVENLYQGGVIFDTMSVRAENATFDGNTFEELSPFNFEEGSNDYANLMNSNDADKIASIEKDKDADHANRSGYSLKFGDGINSKDQAMKGYVVGSQYIKGLTTGSQTGDLAGILKEDFADFDVKAADSTVKSFNTLLLRNLEPTASLFTINSTAEIKANNYYRMSMWIKTLGMDDDKGATINLLQRVSESDYKTPNVLSSFTAVNTKGEWKEYVFYISGNYVDTTDASGAKVDSNLVTVQIVMGSGDSYTPDTHAKGDIMIAALNVQGQITNSEYSGAASGDTVKKYAYSATVSTEDTVTGGRFNSVDYDATTKSYTEKNQKLGLTGDDALKAYGDNGLLTGVGKPSSTTWSLSSPISNQAKSPSSPSLTDTDFKWTGNADAAYYEVYFGTTLIAKVNPNPVSEGADPNYEMVYPRPFKDSGTYYVRTVPKDLSKQMISGKNSMSTTKEATGNNLKTFDEWKKDATTTLPTETKDYSTNFGIIDYKNLSEKNLKDIIGKDVSGTAIGSTGINQIDDIKNLYKPSNNIKYNDTASDIRYYFGAEGMLNNLYNNVLMLSSQYNTRGGYTMYSSTSLSSESYYEISVWVKTMGDAKASFTIDNSTNTFYNTEGTKYIGFNNVSTSGEWVQLKLYAKTGLTSATLKLKLFMGDPYEEDYASGKGLCAGTVFYDDIAMKKLDSKDAYEKLIKDKEVYKDIQTDENDLNGRFFDNDGNIITGANIYRDMTYYKNVYAFKTLEFSIDSFDVSTDSTVTATGRKPDDYTQTVLGSNPSTSDAANANVAYGVYNIPELNEEKFYYLYQNFFGENDSNPAWWNISNIDQLKTFMQGFGDNVLVMSNFVANGMNYKSSSKSIKASSYYQISFYAKLKSADNKTAEFRFYHGDDTTKYEAIEIKGFNSDSDAADHGFVKYTMYVSNPTSSSVSSNYFTFNLGTKTDDETNYMTGMLVIDNVEMFEITEEEYAKVKADVKYDNWSKEEIKKSTSKVNFTKFETKTTDEGDDGDDDDTTGWSAQSWLILSTALIGAIILIAVVVVLIRRFKKKHIKEKAPEVESNVKVEGYVKEKKEQKKDADRREFDD